MISNSMFTNTNLLEKALTAATLRNQVISNNVANVDTPNFKRQVVSFEDALKNITNLNNSYDGAEIDLNTDNSELSYRTDGNNVNIDKEMADMAKNTVKYNVLISQMNSKFRDMKTAIKSNF